jgi:hypothetical protein
MPEQTAKKTPAKKAAPAKKIAAAPAKKVAAPAPAPATKKAAGAKPPSLRDGPYAWMLNRMRSTAVKNVAEEKRVDAKAAAAQATTFAELVEALKPFGFKDTGPALTAFNEQLVSEGITVRGGRAPTGEQ